MLTVLPGDLGFDPSIRSVDPTTVTPVPGDPIPFSGLGKLLCVRGAWCTFIHVDSHSNTNTFLILQKDLKTFFYF